MQGQTPIFIAAASNHAESVYYLAAAKADLSIPGSVTDTSVLSKPTSPVNAAFSAAMEKNLRLTPIDIAAKHGHLLVVKILLETFANAKRQARSVLETALHVCGLRVTVPCFEPFGLYLCRALGKINLQYVLTTTANHPLNHSYTSRWRT